MTAGARELGDSSMSRTGTWQTANNPQTLPPPAPAPSARAGPCKAGRGGWKRGGSGSLPPGPCLALGRTGGCTSREDERPSQSRWTELLAPPLLTGAGADNPAGIAVLARSVPTANNLFLRGKKYICKGWFCWVGAEVWAGGDAQVEFLLGLGHRRLGGRETERSGKLFSP